MPAVIHSLVRAGLLALLALLLMPAPARANALDADMEAMRQREQLAGLVWAWFDGPNSAVGAAGLADVPTARPMTVDARVQVGSVAKTVTALAVLRLVSLGRIALDAPLSALLPDVPLRNPWASSHPLRLRHLLDMTGGLRDVRLHHVFSGRHRADEPLAAAWGDDAELLRLRTPPGEQFSYSNLSFLLLGLVIERTVGEPYGPWIDREVLRPLGMADSSTAVAPLHTPAGAAPLASGHLEDLRAVPSQPFGMRPAGALTTTAADLIRLLRFLASDGQLGGRVGSQPFITPALLRAMGRPQGTAAARAGLASGYGLGLFTRDRHGAVGLCHGGSIAGWRAMACLFPGDAPGAARGFAVVHNSDREGADYGAFDARLVQHLGLQRPPPPLAPAPPPVGHAAWSGLYVADPPRLDFMDLPGRLFEPWWLRIDAGGATLREGLGRRRVLSPEGGTRYRQADRQTPTLALLQDADGRPRLASGMLALRRIGLAEWVALWAVMVVGAGGLLFGLLGLPWRCRVSGRSALQPVTLAGWGLLVMAAVAALRPWQQWADVSLANLALTAASVCLPAAALWQLSLAAQQRRAARAWRLEGAAALAVLVLCGTLAAFGLLPVAPWRW